MKNRLKISAVMLIILLITPDIYAFCGFYVSKAPTTIFNNKSEVILVRDGDKSTITMSNDFQGDVKDFAMVIPVPVVLREDQIKIVNRGVFDRLDAYSAPRLVEYYDANPCDPVVQYDMLAKSVMEMEDEELQPKMTKRKEAGYNVTIEAKYTIGEYDIMLLSAEESNGLERWLTDNDYKIPAGANQVLEPYIKNKTKFFVVKVNLEKHRASGYNYLNPIQISFESGKFMLPIRLGMANAKEAQDLVIYAFTKSGRVEPVNYRTVKIPTDRNVPLFVESYFGEFYKDLFDKSYYREGMNSVFLEYAWNVSPMNGIKCDPCVSPPPVFNDFAEAGVNWVSGVNQQSQVFFTRLHVRYTRNKFPQDLFFQVTPNTENFQARYIMHHPAQGDLSCAAGRDYREDLESRRRVEVAELAALAGWTNPNYADYIIEYSTVNKSDKYAPNRNEFIPAEPGNGDSTNPFSGKVVLLFFGLFGLLSLWVLRRRALPIR